MRFRAWGLGYYYTAPYRRLSKKTAAVEAESSRVEIHLISLQDLQNRR